MSFYIDTSVIVSALTTEARSEDARVWLENAPAGTLSVSDWVSTEVSAALAKKVREGRLTTDLQTKTLAAFASMKFDLFETAPFALDLFKVAARFSDHHTAGLRASDALHLAISSTAQLTLCTFDDRLAKAGPLLRVATLLL